jgi:hypothetical protein
MFIISLSISFETFTWKFSQGCPQEMCKINTIKLLTLSRANLKYIILNANRKWKITNIYNASCCARRCLELLVWQTHETTLTKPNPTYLSIYLFTHVSNLLNTQDLWSQFELNQVIHKTNLCFDKSVFWQICVLTNLCFDKSVFWQISETNLHP